MTDHVTSSGKETPTSSVGSVDSNSPGSSMGTLDVSIDKNTKGSKKGRAVPLYFWSSDDVRRWLQRRCPEMHKLYSSVFAMHEISGRTLLRLTDVKLQIIGISNVQHRQLIMQCVLRLKLKMDAQELKSKGQKVPSIQVNTSWYSEQLWQENTLQMRCCRNSWLILSLASATVLLICWLLLTFRVCAIAHDKTGDIGKCHYFAYCRLQGIHASTYIADASSCCYHWQRLIMVLWGL